MKRIIFILLLAIVVKGFSQAKLGNTIRNHIGFEVGSALTTFNDNPPLDLASGQYVRALKTSPFVSNSIGVKFTYHPMYKDTIAKKNVFSLGMGVDYLNYEIHHHLNALYYKHDPVIETITFSEDEFSYRFQSFQPHLSLSYLRFIKKYFIELNAGVAKVFFDNNKQFETIRLHTINTNGVAQTTSSKEQYAAYPGEYQSVTGQFGISVGRKLGRFLPSVFYQRQNNPFYWYNRFGFSCRILL